MDLRNYRHLLMGAINEDLGSGDVTSAAIIPAKQKAQAVIVAKESGVVAGLPVIKELFRLADKKVKFNSRAKDGQLVKKGKVIAVISGPARSILACERISLNILSHVSGIATLTNQYVKKVKGIKVKVLDTRKTLPGLRALEKYGVKAGGGVNHRMGLYDAVLIKDNHLAVLGKKLGIGEIVKLTKKNAPKNIKVEVEVNTIAQFKQALKERPGIIMLDNMSIADMRKAVEMRNKLQAAGYKPQVLLEASGNVRLDNIRKIASTGVDTISIGAITNSAPALDFSLEIIK